MTESAYTEKGMSSEALGVVEDGGLRTPLRCEKEKEEWKHHLTEGM